MWFAGWAVRALLPVHGATLLPVSLPLRERCQASTTGHGRQFTLATLRSHLSRRRAGARGRRLEAKGRSHQAGRRSLS